MTIASVLILQFLLSTQHHNMRHFANFQDILPRGLTNLVQQQLQPKLTKYVRKKSDNHPAGGAEEEG